MSHEYNQPPASLTFEQVSEAAKDRLLAHGSHPPLLVLGGDIKTVGVELEFPKTSDRRQELMYVLGLGVARTGVVGALRQVFLITEAWMSTAEPGQPFTVLPAEDPQRREVLLISNLHLETRQTRLTMVAMRRDKDGVVRELNDITPDVSDDPGAESPLLNALLDGYTQGRASLT